jgi:hypothetical protein
MGSSFVALYRPILRPVGGRLGRRVRSNRCSSASHPEAAASANAYSALDLTVWTGMHLILLPNLDLEPEEICRRNADAVELNGCAEDGHASCVRTEAGPLAATRDGFWPGSVGRLAQ